MAAVSTVCSLLLALMVVLSGGGNLAGLPEMMDVLTLRNVALEVKMFDEEISLEIPMEFQLASAVGAHEGVLHFEIHDEDGSVLLPVSGRVVSDALQFAIGDSENAYGIYEQTLRDEMMLTEQDEALLEGMGDMLAYIVENGMLAVDPTVSLTKLFTVVADQKQLDAEAASVFYADGEYSAQKRSYSMTREELDALLEAPPATLSEEERQAVEEYAVFDRYYKLMSDYAAGLPEYVGNEAAINFSLNFSGSVDVEITEAEVEGEAYLSVKQNYSVGEHTDYEIEYVKHGDRTRIGQRVASDYAGEYETTQHTMTAELVYDGPITAPEMISMVGMVDNHSEIPGLEGYVYEESTYFYASGGVTDGRWKLDGEATVSTFSGESGAEDAGYGSEISMPFSYLETAEDDGSKTGHFSLRMQMDEMLDLGLSFDLNFAEAPYADFFAGRELLWIEEMSDEQALALEDEWTEALEAAGTAFEAWAAEVENELGLETVQPAGAYVVQPDGSIELEMYDDVQTGRSVNNSIRESIREKVGSAEVEYVDEYEDDYVYEEYDEYDEEYVVPEYYSWAEAQAAFSADIPGYTAPEKWPLQKIEMFHEDYMYASFGEDYDGFSIDVSDYGNDDVERFTLQDGAMVPFEGIVIESYSEDGNIYWATFDYGSCVVSIYFNGEATYADLETILAGFEFE